MIRLAEPSCAAATRPSRADGSESCGRPPQMATATGGLEVSSSPASSAIHVHSAPVLTVLQSAPELVGRQPAARVPGQQRVDPSEGRGADGPKDQAGGFA